MKMVAQFFKDLYFKYKNSRSKARFVTIAVFIVLFLWAVFSMVGSHLSGWNLRHGFLDVSGRVEGHEYHASCKVPGKIIEMYADEGDTVEAGAPVGKIESKQLQAAFDAAKADFALAELEYNRYKVLSAKNAAAKIDFDRAEKNYKVAGEALKKAGDDLDDTIVVAPIGGVVVTKIVREGEVIAAGTPLVSIINMDDLFFKIFLATEAAGKVSIGDEARVFPDALPEGVFEAEVNKISSKAEFTPKNVETKSQRAKLVFEVRMKIRDNVERRLKPGMPANGVIKIAKNATWEMYE